MKKIKDQYGMIINDGMMVIMTGGIMNSRIS